MNNLARYRWRDREAEPVSFPLGRMDGGSLSMLAVRFGRAQFLFRSGQKETAALMRRLLTGYVVGFNRRHRRCGLSA